MRYFLALLSLLLLASVSQAAEPQTSRGIVMAYECEQIDPAATGFSCQFNNGHLRLQWHKNPDNMSKEKQKFALYQFNKIKLRFLSLGGRTFDVGFDSWPENAVRTCSNAKGHPWYETWCSDYGKK